MSCVKSSELFEGVVPVAPEAGTTLRGKSCAAFIHTGVAVWLCDGPKLELRNKGTQKAAIPQWIRSQASDQQQLLLLRRTATNLDRIITRQGFRTLPSSRDHSGRGEEQGLQQALEQQWHSS